MSSPESPVLPDQWARDRFATELEKNFTVRAAAGTGKTTALVHRVTNLLRQSFEGRLAVVTFTRKAAAEIEERILAAVEGNAFISLDRLQVSTIHGLCARMTHEWGALIGYPPLNEPPDNNEKEVWLGFLRTPRAADFFAHDPDWKGIRPYIKLEDLAQLMQKTPENNAPVSDVLNPPDWTPLLVDPYPRARKSAKIEPEQQALKDWLRRKMDGEPGIGIWGTKHGGKYFQEEAKQLIGAEARFAASRAELCLRRLAAVYRRWRLEHGHPFFDDLIEGAQKILDHPVAGKQIRAEGWHVLLDEAQDTTPEQFAVLTSMSAAPDQGSWFRDGVPAAPGRFSMVGDRQQAIHGGSVSVQAYTRMHDLMVQDADAEELSLSVTMRCGSEIVEAVNAWMPPLFAPLKEPPMEFLKMQARPGAKAAQVVRVEPPKRARLGECNADDSLADAFSRWFANLYHSGGLSHLRARSWSEVAILIPKNSVMDELANRLNSLEVPLAVRSRKRVRSDHPAWAWVAALLEVVAYPSNGYELAGLLRELYGISDDAIGRFVLSLPREDRPSLRISPAMEQSPAAQTLQSFRAALEAARMESPLSGLQGLFDSVSLPARLNALEEGLSAESERALQEALEMASEAERSGQSWPELAGHFRRLLSEPPVEEVAPDLPQLLTWHSAKGLGWEAVILYPIPRITRNTPTDSLPRWQDQDGGTRLSLFPLKEPDSESEAILSIREEEHRRLLYVGLTRARNTLVLIDDEADPDQKKTPASLFDPLPDPRGKLPGLASELSPDEQHKAESAEDQPSPLASFLRVLPESLEPLASLPSVRRRLPSSLGHEEKSHAETHHADMPEEPLFEPSPAEIKDPTAYGNWWHEAMENLPWKEPEDAWKSYLEPLLLNAPDTVRACREWGQFLSSELAPRMAMARQVRCEVPFLWNRGEEVWEGIVDVMVQEISGDWWILDWKTDRPTGSDPVQELKERYAPQVRLYAEAWKKVTGKSIPATLYATSLGLWIPL